ncbi:peptide deformylase [Bifidobacterium actinocoloniiforme DSM 22766]|uniref:Peptide deformylase n=1 Tax=Bifidobacterium actinocoloniiforme DSM 22766 TaxID=1437605 RepID=A0A086YZI2_9BIFI|nr:peptide deformylase [Bifidobacterium actinocoloniiforme]AKV55007.1 peptide deformylase [Bifidobacterium actinocoloniiforme DSM 22766]KFI39682.1 peptide deformylase [Bifidobacterium actinocoloniiforme DSM 22766]
MFTRNANVDAELNREVERMLAQAGEDLIVPIVQLGEPVLRQEAVEYRGQLKRKTLLKLIESMRRTMLDAPGVGLAAPQIGLGLAFAVIEDHQRDSEDDPREIAELPFRAIINPHYEPIGDKKASFYEGCLSFSGYQAVRERWLDVQASWEDETGKRHEERLHGWPARIFQHETDHLRGEVYIDQAQTRSLSSDDNLGEYWAYDPVPTQAAKELGFEL